MTAAENRSDRRTRAGAVRAGAVFGTLAAVLLLAAGAGAQDPHIQRLAQQLQSRELEVRRQAAMALGRASYPQSVRLLSRAMPQEQEVSIRLEIVRALRHIVFQRYPGYRDALTALGRAAVEPTESSHQVRLRATQALWEAHEKDLLDPVPLLSRNLQDSQERLRLSAVQMLRQVGTPVAMRPLGQAAMDADQPESIRLAAIDALGAVSLSDPGPAGRSVNEANQRVAELLSIPSLVPAGAMEERHRLQIAYLSAVADEPANSNTLVLQAVRSIGRVKDKSAIPALRRIIATHPSNTVRKQATRVLSHVLARQYE